MLICSLTLLTAEEITFCHFRLLMDTCSFAMTLAVETRYSPFQTFVLMMAFGILLEWSAMATR